MNLIVLELEFADDELVIGFVHMHGTPILFRFACWGCNRDNKHFRPMYSWITRLVPYEIDVIEQVVFLFLGQDVGETVQSEELLWRISKQIRRVLTSDSHNQLPFFLFFKRN